MKICVCLTWLETVAYIIEDMLNVTFFGNKL